jgi:hypothetical protein
MSRDCRDISCAVHFRGPPETPKPALSGRFRIQISPRPPSQKGFLYPSEDAGVAQLAEQLFCKQMVCL